MKERARAQVGGPEETPTLELQLHPALLPRRAFFQHTDPKCESWRWALKSDFRPESLRPCGEWESCQET